MADRGKSTRSVALLLCFPAMLTACATAARLHSEAELNDVGRQCGLALGELFQDDTEKRLLFLFKVQPSPQERTCVYQFARRNHLRLVTIDAINEPAS
ncbi:MAG TPA: hypothetical protein VM760_07140 [Sphingomicrobium sp.]|nr:hypothetical protein [Sphingomicrobium sp.]